MVLTLDLHFIIYPLGIYSIAQWGITTCSITVKDDGTLCASNSSVNANQFDIITCMYVYEYSRM